MEWYLKVVRDNYANFDGRARRKEYWMFTLIHIIIVSLLAGLMMALPKIGMIIYSVYALGTFIPALAVSVRRLHDVGKSGWFLLVGIIPVIGFILLYWAVIDGQAGTNQFGANPKGIGEGSNLEDSLVS